MEAFLEAFTGVNILTLFVKLFGVVLGFLYVFFAAITIRQIHTMKETLTVDDGGTLAIVAYIQLALAIGITIFALLL